jgi:hypothetical protein
LKAFKIDVETLGRTHAALRAGVEALVAETGQLRRVSPAADVTGAVFERTESAWHDFVDDIDNWVTTLESAITRVGTVGSEVAETDDAVARALEKLA